MEDKRLNPKEDEMTVTFHIATDADDTCALAAVIPPNRLAAFLDTLRYESGRQGLSLLDCDGDLEVMLSDGFEARVCPLSLAVLARALDYDPAAISVIDDAQFRGRKITIWQREPGGPIEMCPSFTSDTDAEMRLPNSHAFALLESLGIIGWSMGERPVDDIRRELANPNTLDRMAGEDVAHYVPQLERLLASTIDQDARLIWV